MTRTNLIIFLITVFAVFQMTSAQEKVSDKLKGVKGNVQKITITTENGDVVIEGDDAKKLFNDMKKFSSKMKFKVYSSDGNDDVIKKKKVIIMDSDADDSMIWSSGDDSDNEFDVMILNDDDDFEWGSREGMNKKIKITINDGKKKVEVTTNENGEEKTEVYEGDEAEEYLKKHESGEMKIKIEKPGKDKKVKKIIIEKKSDDAKE